MHVAVTGVHVQGHPHATFEHTLVNGVALIQDGRELCTCEDVLQLRTDLRFPAGTQGVVLQLWEQRIALL